MSYTEVPARSVGDVFTSDPMWTTYIKDNLNKGVVRPIAETTLTVAAASIDFASIAADWSHLLLVISARGDAAATSVALNARVNNDSGANYYSQDLRGNAAAASAVETLAGTAVVASPVVPAATGPADAFGGITLLLPHYAGALDHKSLLAEYFGHRATTSGGMFVGKVGAIWKSAAAVNRVTLSASSGNLDIGTRATLYGMGGI